MTYITQNDTAGVRTLRLARPKKMNAISVDVAKELQDALLKASRDPSVRAIVLGGTGPVFSGGVDVSVFLAMAESRETGVPFADAHFITTLDRALRDVTKPLIAEVNGPAVGMAVTLLPHFDMVYAAERASFTTPFVQLALVLEFGSSFTLPRLIGRQRTNELVLRAKPLDARTAAEWGLVTRVFPDAELEGAVAKIASDIAKHDPGAVADCRRLIKRGEQSTLLQATREEDDVLAARYGSEANVAAVTAFLQKR